MSTQAVPTARANCYANSVCDWPDFEQSRSLLPCHRHRTITLSCGTKQPILLRPNNSFKGTAHRGARSKRHCIMLCPRPAVGGPLTQALGAMNFLSTQKTVAAIFAGILAVLAALYFAHLSDHRYDSRLDRASLDARLRQLAGASAKNCGSVALGREGSSEVACVSSSISHSQPFIFAGQVRGIDSMVWQGLARNADGAMWVLTYDDDATGGSRSRVAYLGVETCKYALVSNNDRGYVVCK